MVRLQEQVRPLGVEAASDAEALDLIEFLSRFPDVALQSWQSAAWLGLELTRERVLAFTVRDNFSGQIVAALLGGVMGTRGIINHLAVDPAYRRNGTARALVESFECALKLRGVYRYFLFVGRDNYGATRFWQAQGMRSTSEVELTMERDIE